MFLSDSLVKFGVIKSLKERVLNHQLFYDLASVALNGTDRTSIELVRLGEMNRVKKKLRKQYKSLINKKLDCEPNLMKSETIVWTLWLQGESNAPDMVKATLSNMRKYCKKLVILDKDNFSEYVTIPSDIIERWKSGEISSTFFSDILRTALLVEHGGFWIDSTVLLAGPDWMSPVIKNSKLFFFQNMRPGAMGNAITLSSWFIKCEPGEPTLRRVQELIYEYLAKNKRITDYFLFHIFWHLVFEAHPETFESIPKVPNALPLQLLYKLNADWNETDVESITNNWPIQKLTYKDLIDNPNAVHKQLVKKMYVASN